MEENPSDKTHYQVETFTLFSSVEEQRDWERFDLHSGNNCDPPPNITEPPELSENWVSEPFTH